MNRQQKTDLIDHLRQEFADSKAAFLIGYQGMTVSDIHTLRKQLRASGNSMKVAKNRLAKRAIEGMEGASELAPALKSQLGIVFASEDPAAAAKILFEYAKTKQALELVAACIDKQLYSKEDIIALATLPPRAVLLAQLMGTMQAPVATYVSQLNQLVARLLYVMQATADKKAQEQQ